MKGAGKCHQFLDEGDCIATQGFLYAQLWDPQQDSVQVWVVTLIRLILFPEIDVHAKEKDISIGP